MRCIYISWPRHCPPLRVRLCTPRTCPSAEVPAPAASKVFLVEFPVDVVEAGGIVLIPMFFVVLFVLSIFFANAIDAAVPVVVAKPSSWCRSSCSSSSCLWIRPVESSSVSSSSASTSASVPSQLNSASRFIVAITVRTMFRTFGDMVVIAATSVTCAAAAAAAKSIKCNVAFSS
jgi:hypothetical protein